VSDLLWPDRAIGVFETLLVLDGSPVELDAHLDRLRLSVRDLFAGELPDGVRRLVHERAAPLTVGRLRLTVAPGPDGALRAEAVTAAVAPEDLFPTWERAIALRPFVIHGGLGAHKWADRAGIAWTESSEAEGCLPLVLDAGGEVLEASRANVFAVEDGALVTPAADGRILPGVARARAIEAARALGLRLREEALEIERLIAAGEAFLTGSVRGIEPVRSVGDAELGPPGDAVAALAAELRRRWVGDPAARRADAMRLVVFTDPDLACSVALLDACLKAAAKREDVEIVGVVDTARAAPARLRVARALAARGLRSAFNVHTRAVPERSPLRDGTALARRRGIAVLAPRDAGVNDASFVAELERLAPDATVALMVAQIFRAPLLAACRIPVNYHDGLLPSYQGVGATAWSIYDGARRSGFTFHLMSEQVDRGAILLQDSVRLDRTSVTARIDRAKTRLASARLHELFDLLPAGARGAVAQDSPGTSFTRADVDAIRTVERPASLTLAELELRLRAFEIVDLTLGGRRVRATALRRVKRRAHDDTLAFTTADGVDVEVSRFLHLPPRAHRVLAPLMG
jgi:branched-subunit amino acid aminotransferase/4-amino-4-deoxychorismate lyase/methionyl-tRNA formyltransferase